MSLVHSVIAAPTTEMKLVYFIITFITYTIPSAANGTEISLAA